MSDEVMETPGAEVTWRRFPRRAVMVGLAILLAGVGLIVVAARIESATLANAPMKNALIIVGAENPWDSGTEMRAREIPTSAISEPTLSDTLRESEQGREALQALDLDRNEMLYHMPESAVDWETMLAKGRLPEPGKAEVLAGPLARFDRFTLGETTFTAVGTLNHSVSGFTFAFVLPASDKWNALFTEDSGGQDAWLVTDGFTRLEEEADPSNVIDTDDGGKVFGGKLLATPLISWLTWTGLVLVGLGGAIAQVLALQWWAHRSRGFFRPALIAMNDHAAVLVMVHLVLYALLFGAMAAAASNPLLNLRFATLVSNEFREGGLSFIGRAYQSGNILYAAAMTWVFNFGMATVAMSALPSFVIPAWAFIKNAFTFATVGFAMAPLWMPAAGPMTYHSITLTLELQAYVYVSFAALVFPEYVLAALFGRGSTKTIAQGAKILASTVALAGLLLAIAALYEATTLILFRF